MRPRPPKKLFESLKTEFVPAPELGKFFHENFLNEDSKLYNYDHRHLRQARIGYLWTNCPNKKQMKQVVATCEIPKPSPLSSVWEKEKYFYQLRGWFGRINLDFLITLDANYARDASNIEFLAVFDHEHYHCGHKRDEFGQKEYSKTTGKPKFALLGHSVEEFTGIIERYGFEAGAGETVEFIKAAKRKPTIGKADIKTACGTCKR